jgi:pimeloyl-ACP methyl ester carboxylesterase
MQTQRHVVRTADGRDIEYLTAGPDDGLPLVIHEGTPVGLSLNARLAGAAAERDLRAVLVARPGYEASTPRPGRTVADVVPDAAAVLDALGAGEYLSIGFSGGGPHALACAALLGDRVAAAATLASVAPHEAEGLDWMAGMGEDNVKEFTAAFAGPEALAAFLEPLAAEALAAGPHELAQALDSVLSPPDKAVLTGEMAEELVAELRAGIGERRAGWLDDDLAFVKPWGFDVRAIAVPVLLWQGRQDLMVPPTHGEWLGGRVGRVEPHVSDADGHLTLAVTRLGEIHAWLLERF